MDRDPERHSLSPDALQKIYETRVAPRLFRGAESVEQPTAIVLGGQPGSGKTPMQNHATREFAGNGGMVKIIGDDLRAYLPHYKSLQRADDKTAALYTDRDSGRLVEKAIAEAAQRRVNVLVEGTMRNPETVAATLQQFRDAGFRTDARALAVSPEMSSLGVLQRYAAQKESRGIGRMTTTEAHQNALRGMLDTLDRIQDGRLWIAALALLLWSFSDSELLRTICIQVATVAGVTTLLFNLNPLGRMDGYYVLGDLTERPNLLGQASQAAIAFAARLFRVSPQAVAIPPDWPLLAYWLGGYAYRVLVFIGMAWLVHGFAPWLSLAIALIAVSLLIVRPALGTARALTAMTPEPAPVQRRLRLTGAAIVGAAALVPLPAGVASFGVVELPASTLIYAPRDARILAVAPAGPAAADAPVLQLLSPEAEAGRAAVAARREAAVIAWRRAADAGAGGTQSAAEQVQRLDAQLRALDDETARLETIATTPGRFDPLDSPEMEGSWVTAARDRPLGLLQRDGPARLHLLVPEERVGSLAAGGRIVARIWGRPGQFGATVERVGERIAQLPSAALGRAAGGQIETRPDDAEGKTPMAGQIEYWAKPDPGAPPLFMGQRLEARIGQPPRPLFWQLAKAAVRLLDVRAQRSDS